MPSHRRPQTPGVKKRQTLAQPCHSRAIVHHDAPQASGSRSRPRRLSDPFARNRKVKPACVNPLIPKPDLKTSDPKLRVRSCSEHRDVDGKRTLSQRLLDNRRARSLDYSYITTKINSYGALLKKTFKSGLSDMVTPLTTPTQTDSEVLKEISFSDSSLLENTSTSVLTPSVSYDSSYIPTPPGFRKYAPRTPREHNWRPGTRPADAEDPFLYRAYWKMVLYYSGVVYFWMRKKKSLQKAMDKLNEDMKKLNRPRF